MWQQSTLVIGAQLTTDFGSAFTFVCWRQVAFWFLQAAPIDLYDSQPSLVWEQSVIWRCCRLEHTVLFEILFTMFCVYHNTSKGRLQNVWGLMEVLHKILWLWYPCTIVKIQVYTNNGGILQYKVFTMKTQYSDMFRPFLVGYSCRVYISISIKSWS